MIVPDEILECNFCQKCNQYLTIGPISNHSGGGNVCGRCQTTKAASILYFECDPNLAEQEFNIPYTLFAYMNHLFPCVNRYEGCNKLMDFGEIAQHEVECRKYRKTPCNICKNFEGSGSQLIIHFKAKHGKNYHDEKAPLFRIPLKSNSSNLVKRNNSLFFVEVELNEPGKQVKFCVEPLKDSEEDYEFLALIKDPHGDAIYQSTRTSREKNITYDHIEVNDATDLKKMFCDCLLKVSE